MPISEAKKKSNAAYNRRQDNIMLRPTKEDGARIRKAASGFVLILSCPIARKWQMCLQRTPPGK